MGDGLEVEPSFDGCYFVFADDDLFFWCYGHVYAHFSEEECGEFLYCLCVDDVLSVDSSESLWVELLFDFFECHVECVSCSVVSAQFDYSVSDGDMADVGDGYDEVFVCPVWYEESLSVAYVLCFY